MDLRQIRRSGGSFFVVIPPKYVTALELRGSEYVRLELLDNTILINKVDLAGRLKARRKKGEAGHGG